MLFRSKAFNREKDTIEEFEKTNNTLYDSAWKSQFLSGMMHPIMMFVGNLGYACVALSGGLLAIRGVITVGDIQAFISLAVALGIIFDDQITAFVNKTFQTLNG